MRRSQQQQGSDRSQHFFPSKKADRFWSATMSSNTWSFPRLLGGMSGVLKLLPTTPLDPEIRVSILTPPVATGGNPSPLETRPPAKAPTHSGAAPARFGSVPSRPPAPDPTPVPLQPCSPFGSHTICRTCPRVVTSSNAAAAGACRHLHHPSRHRRPVVQCDVLMEPEPDLACA